MAKSWLLGCPEVASPVSWGLCCGRGPPACILGLCRHVPAPDKECLVGMVLPFEVASLSGFCGCYRAALSRELLTQLASSSLLSPTLGWAVGAEAAGSVAGGQTAVPSCRAACQPRVCRLSLLWHPQGWQRWHSQLCRDAESSSLPCLAGADLPPALQEAALFPVLDR